MLEKGNESIRTDCYYRLSRAFYTLHNPSAALKYSKLAYEHCLRSPNRTKLNNYKLYFHMTRLDLEKLPPLRFAVGDEVEFLHELETGSGSDWRLGRVVEQHYWERDFAISFSASYRLQLLDDSHFPKQPPIYACVEADIDRYIRKVGVRSIEDTRYQARLDAKVAELARVYCSKEFIIDIYVSLALDLEFVDMLESVWRIKLSVYILHKYRMFVMYRQPLVRTDTGYHVPSSEEVIAGIKAYFDPAHLSGEVTPTAAGEDSDSQPIRDDIISMLRDVHLTTFSGNRDEESHRGLLFRSVKAYFWTLSYHYGLDSTLSRTCVDAHDWSRDLSVPSEVSGFSVPAWVSKAISQSATTNDMWLVQSNCGDDTPLVRYLATWIPINICVEESNAGPACECPFVYFCVKFCLDQGVGVPKRALALYDRMNMQLSREFIRCANTSCELNKLDKSTGQVKFKMCSRCKAVIYCSRECQVAHYPEHKRLCKEHSTD